jgi:site-specific recombinase XerD
MSTVKTTATEPLITDAFLNFSQTIKSPKTRANYIQALKYYMKFSRLENYDDLLRFSSTQDGLLAIQKNIIMFIEYCKQRKLSYNTIHGYITGLHHFYEYNDVNLKWKRINAHLPSKEKRIDDRAYTNEEIKKMLDIANLRDKAILLIMASSGPRVDAVPSLRIKDLTAVDYNSVSIYEIRYYRLSNDEYRGYCTPEAKKAIDEYLRWRKQCGERITENSPLFRKEFSRRDDIDIANAESITKASINHIVVELLDRSAVRPRGRMTPEELQRGLNTKRTEIQMNHAFRKFTISNMIRARLEPNARRLLVGQELEGMDSHYDRREQAELLEEYCKAVDYLTIDPTFRMSQEIQTLRVEKSRIDKLEENIKKFDDLFSRFL